MANYVYATDPRKPIPIGVQGENDARTVVFDIHKWIEDYGNGSALLVHQRPGDAEPYPVTTAQKAGTVEWTVQQADIIAGAPGRAQLSYQVGENIVARSPIYLTIAADEITNTPLSDYDPAKSWIDDLLDAVNKAGDITSDVQAAQTAAAQAGQSATAAAGSASDAEESATAAASSAAQAAQHAGEVTSGVQAAAQSATQAAGSATAASGSASAAAGSATEAAGSAADAAESAGNAAESASQAASSASAAQEAAESAQEYSGKPPIIQNDTWWTWDAESDAYEDTEHPATGEGAGFGKITATVGATVGTPSVSVVASGPDTAKKLAFIFTNLKGEPGQSVGSIQRTAGTGAPGTTDTYTMYDDGGGTIGTFTVYNGINGTGSGDFMADGTVPMTGDLNVGGHRVTNVGAPTAAGDAVRQSDLQAVSDEIDAIIAGTTPVAVPVATDAKAGVVMPGNHLSVEADGTLNAEWPDLSGYATQDWVNGQNFLTSTDLIPYATQTWVNSQNFLTAVPAGYATENWVQQQGYLTDVPDKYVTADELAAELTDYATKDYISGLGYITSAALNGYATQTWVGEQGFLTAVPDEYITETELTEKGYITSTALGDYATTTYVDDKIGTINTALDTINGEVI